MLVFISIGSSLLGEDRHGSCATDSNNNEYPVVRGLSVEYQPIGSVAACDVGNFWGLKHQRALQSKRLCCFPGMRDRVFEMLEVTVWNL